MSAPLRVGVVGVGLMGAEHADRIARRVPGAVLAAVSDPDVTRARRLAAAYDDVRVVDDPLALVSDPDLDAVVLASPGAAHEEQLLACLEQERPVLCEKPMTMDSASSMRVLEAERAVAERVGHPLVSVGFMRRFDPDYLRLKGALDTGEIGRLLLVHNVHRNRSVPNADFRSEMIVRDSLVHEVDVARFLFGEEIATVHVIAPRPTSYAARGVLDPQVAVFTMAGGGVVTSEVFVNAQTGYEVRCEAVGETGSVIIGQPWGGVYATGVRSGWGGPLPGDYRERFAAAYDAELASWVAATRRGEVVGATAWDGYAATVVATAGMESLRAGAPVAVELGGAALRG